MQSDIILWIINHILRFGLLEMKLFVVLSVLVAGAMSARLDNTYIPPASAHSAGGFNLDTPKQAHASNIQNTYAAPGGGRAQTQFQQQSHSQPGLNHGTFTSVSKGNGFQSVSAGSYSGNAGQGGFQQQSYQAPQQRMPSYQAQQPNYQQQQASYPAAQPQYNTNYQQNQQSGYNPNTTPIPILECKKIWWEVLWGS